MKRCRHGFVLLSFFALMLAWRAPGQTFRTLHDFPPFTSYPQTNGDGVLPAAGLVQAGSVLYGTAAQGGISGQGVVFRLNTDGTGLKVLHNFSAVFGKPATNSDGATPYATLLLSGGTLYGTARAGGPGGSGTVFSLNTDGTGFKTLYNFTAAAVNTLGWLSNRDGANPLGSLVLSSNTLYGTAQNGGSPGWGTVFAVNTDGTGFTNLHVFANNGDGARPSAGLLLAGSTLYGTTTMGQTYNQGTVFAVNTDGTGFKTLYQFSPGTGADQTNQDGGHPIAGLILSGRTLYGTASSGGSSGRGTVFVVNTDGSGFTNLYTFTGSGDSGATPQGTLLLSGDTLYGTTLNGGAAGSGTVFGVGTAGTGYATLHSFGGGSDGGFPAAGLLLSGQTLFGTSQGSAGANGTVFSLTFTPQLTITRSQSSVVLSWSTQSAGHTLESSTNLAVPTAWTTNATAPIVVNGQNTVTLPIAGAQLFFRLVP